MRTKINSFEIFLFRLKKEIVEILSIMKSLRAVKMVIGFTVDDDDGDCEVKATNFS